MFALTAETSVVGRHASADVRFDPDSDLEVSARHALITRVGDGWVLRDLESRNGTWVNGRRIVGDTPLRTGDRITFGTGGPAVQFSTIAEPAPRHTRGVRVLAGALALLFVVSVGTYALVDSRRTEAAWERERAALQQQTDSVRAAAQATVRTLEGQVQALTAALQRSESEVRIAQTALRQAESRGETTRIPLLRRELARATSNLHQQRRAAARPDFAAIQRANRPAVALVYVESQDGQVTTGTAFAVRPNALLLTNRHVVAGAAGSQGARRIAVQFSDSEQVWPARVLSVSAEADLAVLKVDNIIGRVPTIRSFNLRADTLAQGTQVAWIGFPNGGDAEAPEGKAARLARPVLSSGAVSRVASGRLEVQGPGAEGASGSPFFDANGQVVGVLLGGRSSRAGHTVYGVPASAAVKLLDGVR